MNNNRLQFITKVVFFGALWGLIEATIGYALHFLPVLIAGSIMFPIVMYILYLATKSLGSRKAIFYVAFIAIAIKATNLFLPMLYPAKTINPMIAMFIQSLLAFAVMPMLNSQGLKNKISALAIASISWRLVMIGYYGLNYLLTGFMDFRIAEFNPAFTYVVTEGLISLALAVMVFQATKPIKTSSKWLEQKLSPVFSSLLLVVAVILTLVKF